MTKSVKLKDLFEKHKNDIVLCLFILEWIALVIAYITAVVFIDKHVEGLLDLDLSAELVNGNILSKEGGIIAKDWYFSTELRVLNVPLVYAILFRLSDSWHSVRVVSSAILLLILVCSALYCAWNMGLKRIFPLIAMLFILPFSPTYLLFITCGLYYIPHIAFSLFTMGMIFALSNAGKKKMIVLLAVLVLLSCIAGIGGIRMIAVLYLPLVMTVVIMYLAGYGITDKNRFPIIGIFLSFAASMAGLFINGRLHSVYSFQEQKITFTYMDQFYFSERVINPVLDCFGYSDTALDLWTLIRNFFCAFSVLLVIISLIYHLKRKEEEGIFLTVFYIIAMCILLVVFLFTDNQFRIRYYCPVIYFTFFLMAKMFTEIKDSRILVKRGVAVLYVVLACLASFNVYNIYKYCDITKDLRDAGTFLSDNGYINGYAGGYGPQLTELSNGKLDVWNWDGGDIDNQTDPDEIMEWLQKKSHQTGTPVGKVFILLNKEQYSIIPCRDRIKEHKIYENNDYVIFGFDDYGECRNKFEDK